jgi:hypothetical protein
LDIFQVHILTENGHLYSLCPVLPKTLILRDEHFSQIDVLLNDQVKDREELKPLITAFRAGKTKIPTRPGFCFVKLKPEQQQALKPSLIGPLKVENRELKPSVKYRQVLAAASFPFSLLCLSESHVELMMTFELA